MDAIIFCSDLYNKANAFDHTVPGADREQAGPTRSSRAAAMVHLAMHDAFFGVAGLGAGSLPANVTPTALYLGSAAPAPYAGPGGAAAQSSAISEAARVMLTYLYRNQAAMFDTAINRLNAANGAVPEALAYGHAIAAALIALRANDGSGAGGDAYVYGNAKPRHRSDPINANQDALGASWGSVATFAVSSFQPQAAPPTYAAGPTNAAYLDDAREVAVKGSAVGYPGTTRTPEETVIGLYWAYDGAMKLGTPPHLYNAVLAQIATEHGNSLAQNARLFGLANAAMGDAGIHAWYYKYAYDLWRPVVGLREHDANFGPDARGGQAISPPCDPFWRPLGAPSTNNTAPGARSFTPNFPAYPSGHATFGAAVFEIARVFYGHADPKTTDSIGFTFVSAELDGTSVDNDGTVRTRHVRRFTSVADAMYENSISRIFLGVHWRFDGTTGNSISGMLKATDDIGGVPLGRAIAQNIVAGGLVQSPAVVPRPPVLPAN